MIRRMLNGSSFHFAMMIFSIIIAVILTTAKEPNGWAIACNLFNVFIWLVNIVLRSK